MKRIVKILSIILIICVVLTNVCSTAFALTPEIVSAAGGLGAIIALIMGVKYGSDNMSSLDLTNFFNDHVPQSTDIGSFVLDIIHNPVGTVSVFINKAFFDYLKNANSNIIEEYNIIDNSLQSLTTYQGYTYEDYVFSEETENHYFAPLFQGPEFSVNNNYLIGSYSLGYYFSVGRLIRYTDVSCYYNGNVIGNSSSTNPSSPGVVGFAIPKIGQKNIVLAYKGNAKNYLDYSYYIGEIAEYVEKGLDIETGIIDENIGDNIPLNGGAVITIPESGKSDILEIIEDIIDKLLNGEEEEIEIELVEDAPTPDYGPMISDTPFIDLIGLFRHLEQEIEEIFVDTVGSVAEVIEDIGTDIIGIFGDLETWIADTVGTIGDTIEDIGQDVIGIGESVIETVESIDLSIDSIVEGITDIAEKIETGIIELFQGFIQGLNRIFSPILLRIKSALSIWHYVVEWMQSVGGIFTWIFGIASQTSYYIVLPIYASIAAAITIAIYKRFGR